MSCSKEESLCLWHVHGLSVKSLSWNGKESEMFCRMAEFYLFVCERQRIWVRRKRNDPKPWSICPIFQDYSFCNVYRELDRGTQFFHEHIVVQWQKQITTTECHQLTRQQWIRKVLFASYIYRQVNRLDSFVEIGIPDESNVHRFLTLMWDFKDNGKTFFSSAHQTTGYRPFEEAVIKITERNGQLLADTSQALCNSNQSKEWIGILRTLPLVGPFFAWQILCDLHESKCIESFVDDYCELGPGAIGTSK
jgi:alpha-glutamyl/putrescinyl thymine pyrophosphorylase clade 1